MEFKPRHEVVADLIYNNVWSEDLLSETLFNSVLYLIRHRLGKKHQLLLELTIDGLSVADIAQTLQWTSKSVHREKSRLKKFYKNSA